MAATLVGGAFLSATVQTLVEKLASTEFRDYIKNTKLNESLLAELKTTLLALQAVLDDAEMKQITNTAVETWLDELKDAIFDAEDLLNQINYDALRCKMEGKQGENITGQVWNLISSPFKNIYAEINLQMKIMCQRLQLFAQQRNILGLQTVSGRVSRRTPSSSMVNESFMVGRKDDKEELISMLLSHSDTNSNNIGVVAIWGMGGVGKTTLAQLLYNDKKVQEHFDLKVWVCVSEDFNILRVTKSLLESITSRGSESANLDFLRRELNKNLSDKRFLLVLDDLWNDNYNDWHELVTPLINGKIGSRVIITTRHQKVAEVAHTFPIHKVETLSDDIVPFYRKQLVLLWMAEGFLEHSLENKTPEEVGDDYVNELLSRSLIQVQQSDSDFGGQELVMHDLVNDLASMVSGKSYFRLECSSKISKNVRHLSYNQEFYDIFKKFEVLDNFKCLRSFLPVNLFDFSYDYYLSRKVVEDLLPKLIRLRVMSLSSYRNITTLPESIGRMVLLQYLDLSFTGIKSLPDAICKLYNLQTLNLMGCMDLTELPLCFGQLINLRHLDISETNINEMPKQIVGLENLQTLTVFVVGKQEIGLSVKDLGKFPNLQGELCIKNLHNVIDAVDASDANMRSKEHIEELELQWSKQTEDSRMEKDVLDMLKPSLNLNKLSIDLYGGTSFPSWLGDSSFSNMVSLCISNCEYCITVPPLGQLPSLKDLTISGMKMEIIGIEFYGMTLEPSISSFQPFRSLEKLYFVCMPNWKEWIHYESGEVAFPRLRTLSLRQCPKLMGHMPNHLSSIDEVSITCCDSLLTTPHTTLHWVSSLKKIRIEKDKNSLMVSERTQLLLPVSEKTQWLLPENDSPCLLQSLFIRYYDTLFSLPKMIMSSNCLQSLKLYDIPSLGAFPTDGLPTSLQSLTIYNCENLAFLPLETWGNYTSLVNLHLAKSCNSLTSFALDGFPTLRRLHIDSCTNLESIFISKTSLLLPSSLTPRMETLTSLEYLYLKNLPKLSFCEGACLPPNLEYIYIGSVRITTPIFEWGLQRLTALSTLSIGSDDDIVNTLLKEILLPISLRDLFIHHLSEIKSFEGNGLRHLSSLEALCFNDCPRLEYLLEDTLPSSLKILRIVKCPLLEARYKSQRLEHLSNLVLRINDEVII
uniref:LOW QUALITY PROTEIN: putative disease resistance RPP13-like protein 1 n=1 Tax=Cicer arietinum TaxID=3827 RepID=A0A3Q7XGX2_CICAR|nr:LOW QUALITY PROTEIN: putative disease resistance RPP13-like protein 1 [Cicer arietinum]